MVYMPVNHYESARRAYYAPRFTSDESAQAAAATRQKAAHEAAATHLELLLTLSTQSHQQEYRS